MTQIEATTLISIQKEIDGGAVDTGPSASTYSLIPKIAGYEHQNFILDLSKGSISITKTTTQKRVRSNIVLIRLDTDAYHLNPPFSDEILLFINDVHLISMMRTYSEYRFTKENHLHIYIQHFGEKWAFPPHEFGISCGATHTDNIREFCTKYNIDMPIIRGGLL